MTFYSIQKPFTKMVVRNKHTQKKFTFIKKLGQICATSLKKVKMLKSHDIIFVFAKIASFFIVRLLFICIWDNSFSTLPEKLKLFW